VRLWRRPKSASRAELASHRCATRGGWIPGD
jgi:hypothetical protein